MSHFTIQGINAEVRRLTQKSLDLEAKCRAEQWNTTYSKETKEELKKICTNKMQVLEANITLLLDEKLKLIEYNKKVDSCVVCMDDIIGDMMNI